MDTHGEVTRLVQMSPIITKICKKETKPEHSYAFDIIVYTYMGPSDLC